MSARLTCIGERWSIFWRAAGQSKSASVTRLPGLIWGQRHSIVAAFGATLFHRQPYEPPSFTFIHRVLRGISGVPLTIASHCLPFLGRSVSSVRTSCLATVVAEASESPAAGARRGLRPLIPPCSRYGLAAELWYFNRPTGFAHPPLTRPLPAGF